MRELSPRLAKDCEVAVSDMRKIVEDFHQRAQSSFDMQLKGNFSYLLVTIQR